MRRRQERVFIIAAFGDIRGFGSYTQRITDEETQIVPFFDKYDDIVDAFESRHDYFLKHLGDGFLCIAKIKEGKAAGAAKFLIDLWTLNQEVQRHISRTKYPRPDGFRIRIAAGHVRQVYRQTGSIDFRGYHINLAAKMLKVEKENHAFIVHESAKQILSKAEMSREGFRFKLLPPPPLRRYPEGVYKEDLSVLWSMDRRKK